MILIDQYLLINNIPAPWMISTQPLPSYHTQRSPLAEDWRAWPSCRWCGGMQTAQMQQGRATPQGWSEPGRPGLKGQHSRRAPSSAVASTLAHWCSPTMYMYTNNTAQTRAHDGLGLAYCSTCTSWTYNMDGEHHRINVHTCILVHVTTITACTIQSTNTSTSIMQLEIWWRKLVGSRENFYRVLIIIIVDRCGMHKHSRRKLLWVALKLRKLWNFPSIRY